MPYLESIEPGTDIVLIAVAFGIYAYTQRAKIKGLQKYLGFKHEQDETKGEEQ